MILKQLAIGATSAALSIGAAATGAGFDGIVSSPWSIASAELRPLPPRESDSWESKRVSCRTGNFTGEARVRYRWRDDGNWKVVDVVVDQYRIDRLHGQSGGNKANVNLNLHTYDGVTQHWNHGWSKSSDSMQQDGASHPINLALSGHAPAYRPYAPSSAAAIVEFVFDKSGPDPRCEASASLTAPA